MLVSCIAGRDVTQERDADALNAPWLWLFHRIARRVFYCRHFGDVLRQSRSSNHLCIPLIESLHVHM